MQRDQLYKHENNTDVAFQMKERYYEKVDGELLVQMQVNWFNIVNPENVYLISKNDLITIRFEDLPNWRPFP